MNRTRLALLCLGLGLLGATAPRLVSMLVRGNLTPVGDVRVSIVDPAGNGFSPLSDMSPNLPSAAAISAGTSVEVFPLTGGSHLRVTCGGVPVQFRTGIHPLVAVATDSDILSNSPLEPVTLKSTENAIAFFSAAGTTCKVSVRNTP